MVRLGPIGIIVVTAGLLSLTGPVETRAQASDPARRADAWIKEQMATRKIPGMSVAVVQDGRIVFDRAYGSANLELGVPVTTRTRFIIASVTKTWAATAIMMLVEQGKVRLDQPIGDLLPDLPASWRGAPVRRLLSHTSGLPDVVVSGNTGELLAYTKDSALALAGAKPLEFPGGTQWSYNQTNYVLLGMVIERVTGMPFMTWILEHLAKPLGLTSPIFGDSRAVVPGRATHYTRFAVSGRNAPRPIDSLRVKPYLYEPWMHLAAGLNTSAADLAQFADAVRAGRLITSASRDTMWTAVTLADGKVLRFSGTAGMGLGWMVDDDPAGKIVGMSGGAAASLEVYPTRKLTVAVLTNLQGAGPEELSRGVAGFFK